MEVKEMKLKKINQQIHSDLVLEYIDVLQKNIGEYQCLEELYDEEYGVFTVKITSENKVNIIVYCSTVNVSHNNYFELGVLINDDYISLINTMEFILEEKNINKKIDLNFIELFMKSKVYLIGYFHKNDLLKLELEFKEYIFRVKTIKRNWFFRKEKKRILKKYNSWIS